MENAGRNAAAVVMDVLREDCRIDPGGSRVAVLCGGGNNGGDGYVIARHLHNAGVDVTLYTACDPDRLTGDAAVNHAVCSRMGLAVEPITSQQQLDSHAPAWQSAHVVVDALLGTGFAGEVRSHMAQVIGRCNGLLGPKVVAVDTPSGLDVDSGEPSNATIRADVTVTFVAEKRGFATPSAKPYVGRAVVADIGAPPGLIGRVLGGGG
jgi:hydroxyethylthiazole kinase-like uncharacterized protein yjeF